MLTTTTTDTAATTAAPLTPTAAVAAVKAAVAPKGPRVNVVVPEGKKSPIVAYQNSPEFGYIQLMTSVASFGTGPSGWARSTKKSTLLKGDIALLEQIVRENVAKDMTMPGGLFVREFLANEIPEAYLGQLDADEEDLDVKLANVVKKAGKDGPILSVGGVPIVRFTDYLQFPADDERDTTIAHDNVDEVTAYREQQKQAKAASLPGSGN